MEAERILKSGEIKLYAIPGPIPGIAVAHIREDELQKFLDIKKNRFFGLTIKNQLYEQDKRNFSDHKKKTH